LFGGIPRTADVAEELSWPAGRGLSRHRPGSLAGPRRHRSLAGPFCEVWDRCGVAMVTADLARTGDAEGTLQVWLLLLQFSFMTRYHYSGFLLYSPRQPCFSWATWFLRYSFTITLSLSGFHHIVITKSPHERCFSHHDRKSLSHVKEPMLGLAWSINLPVLSIFGSSASLRARADSPSEKLLNFGAWWEWERE
jgi:hypothetical protein